jgi:integrase
VFPGRGGEPLRHGHFYGRAWQPALEQCGLPRVGVHVLRHSAAAALIASEASPKAVQSILGHRSAAFTLSVYGHLFDADMDDVASRLDATVSNLVRDGGGIAVMPSGPAAGPI